MRKLDTHVHTLESSGCGRVPGADMARLYYDAGFDGIIITDHFLPLGVFAHSEPLNADGFLAGYRAARNQGEALGLRVLLGAELRFENGWEDYLLFGIDEAVVRELCALRDGRRLTLRGVKVMADTRGWLIYQAHPFRDFLTPASPKYLHGVETLNMNPRHEARNDRAEVFAKRHKLLTLAGSDAHQASDVGATGIYVPKEALENAALVKFLNETREPQTI